MLFFFFNDTATTEIYTLSLHDALPISRFQQESASRRNVATAPGRPCRFLRKGFAYAFLRGPAGLQNTHAYVDGPTRAATAAPVGRHGPLDRRPGGGGPRDPDRRRPPCPQRPGPD